MRATVPAARAGAGRRAIAWQTPARRAFSLIEVIAAVVIFGIGMIAVLGMFAPVTKSVSSVGEAEAAARVADAVRARLQALSFTTALTLVQEVADVRRKDGDGGYNPAADADVADGIEAGLRIDHPPAGNDHVIPLVLRRRERLAQREAHDQLQSDESACQRHGRYP